MHDSTKVLMGSVATSERDETSFDTDPSDCPAGVAVSLGSTGQLSVALSAGERVGISSGKSLSDHKQTSVVRSGLGVPVLITRIYASLEVGDLTFTAVDDGADGNNIEIILLDDAEAGAETVDVDDLEITVHMDDGESTAQQIADAVAASAEASALVTVAIADGEEDSAQSDAASAPLEDGVDSSDWIALGAKVYLHDVTGRACPDDDGDATISDATYASAEKTAQGESGNSDKCVLVDMPGGL